jgi:hypothetical protein
MSRIASLPPLQGKPPMITDKRRSRPATAGAGGNGGERILFGLALAAFAWLAIGLALGAFL